jgi:hypothetical protein
MGEGEDEGVKSIDDPISLILFLGGAYSTLSISKP